MADIQATQSVVLAAVSIPSVATRGTQALVEAAVDSNGGVLQTTQALVLAAVIGRVSDPNLRVWTATLDGHDLVFFRLGDYETLVYDTHSEQWYNWGSGDSPLWRVYNGTNWDGGTHFGQSYGSNIVVGDDANGSLYFLDPNQETDDDVLDGAVTPREFLRQVTGQVLLKGYDRARCFQVQLLGSVGDIENTSLTDVTLEYSDDRGMNYVSAGTVTVPADDFDARVAWRSLGSFRSPGRLFRISDYGALARIDTLDMMTDLEE